MTDRPRVLPRLTRARAEALIGAIGGRRVLVAGDLMSDRYLGGVVERISPEAPVPVLRVREEWSRIGGAGNVAANVTALGGRCDLIGVVGADPAGRELLDALTGSGIGISGVRTDDSRPTSVKTRLVARGQQVARFDLESEGPVPEAIEAALRDEADRLLDEVHAVAIEDYNKGVMTPGLIRSLIEGATARGLPIVVDPKRHHFFDFHGATIFKPNAKELADALGGPLTFEIPGWLESVRERVGAEHILLTRGEEGMLLHGHPPGFEQGETVSIAATARSVFDVSGAGDTVTAVLALALGAGASPEEAALFANEAAGIEVAKAGVATVSPVELLRAIQENS